MVSCKLIELQVICPDIVYVEGAHEMLKGNDNHPVGVKTRSQMKRKPDDTPELMRCEMTSETVSTSVERQPGEDTAYKRILRDGRVPPITEAGQSQEEGNDQVRRLEEGDGTTRMTGGGPDAGPGTMSGTLRGEALSVPAPQLHLPPPLSEVPDWSDGEAMPLIIIEASSVPPTPTKTIDGLLVDSDGVLRLSPEMNSSGDPGILSAPLSPNRVRTGHSQDMPAEGSLFDVSPDIPGFHMRPAGASVQQADITEPPPPNYVGFDNPFFGTPIAFAQCRNTAGMDTTTTLPVYSIPRNCGSVVRADGVCLGGYAGYYTLVNSGGYHTGHRTGRAVRPGHNADGYGRQPTDKC